MMTPAYLEQMRAHVDEDGTLNHRNAVELMAALELCRAQQIGALRGMTSWLEGCGATGSHNADYREGHEDMRQLVINHLGDRLEDLGVTQ